VTKDFEKEVSRMGNISIGIREEAWDEAWKEATSHFIINLMDTLGYTQEEAMKALKISDYEKPKYEDLIRESKAVYEADDKE